MVAVIDAFRDHTGVVRKLGYKAPSEDKVKLRAGRTNIRTLVTSPDAIDGLIPQEKWKEVDFVTGRPAELINNQGQEGACVGASGCGASQRMRYMRDGQILMLSWTYLYDQINGGVDQGANIIDSMNVLEKVGVPLLSVYPTSRFKENLPLPAGTLMYKEDLIVTVTDSLECATALQLGILPQVPIYVNNNFDRFTGEGIAWSGKAPRGNASNHSIYLAGMKFINSVWYFILVNSWGINWGPFNNGTCLIPMAGVDNPAMTDDGYGHASTSSPLILPASARKTAPTTAA